MSDTSQQWVGQVVGGKFPLLRFLGGSGRSAVFLTERHEGERVAKAAIKLIPSLPESDELQLARWRLAAELSHPHLISIFDMGRCELGEAALLYVVMECAEENLAEVLGSRALTPHETREMLAPVLEALGYLHDKGLVHGHLRPATIMADGDQLKIAGDGLCRAGDSSGLPRTPNAYDPPENSRGMIPMTAVASPAGDVWSLGITLVEALTQHAPALPSAGQGEVPLPEDLPEPFIDIARHCLVRHPEGRWTVAEIAARLEGRVPAVAARPVAAAVVPRPVARPQRVTARSRKPLRPQAGRRGYALPVILVLGVLAIVFGPRLLHRTAAIPQPAAPPGDQPGAQLQSRQEPDTTAAGVQVLGETSKPGAAQKAPDDERAAAVPASVRPGAADKAVDKNEDKAGSGPAANLASKPPVGVIVRGAVIERALPSVPQSAQDSIQGTVKVSVSVDVDSSGNVEKAELNSGGPSKYFAKLALEAAQRWKFQPPAVAGQNAVSRWNLRFDFTRDGVAVVPAQDAP